VGPSCAAPANGSTLKLVPRVPSRHVIGFAHYSVAARPTLHLDVGDTGCAHSHRSFQPFHSKCP